MSTLILYSSKKGATRKIAGLIAERIPQAVCVDIRADTPPPLENYRTVIVGSSLTAGQISREMKRFVKENLAVLQQKRVGIFLSGMDAQSQQQYFQANFPAALLQGACATVFLGGIYDPTQCGAMTRMLIKKAAGIDSFTDSIDHAAIERFAAEIWE